VLDGTASAHSDINIQVFADSDKELELYLINQAMAYQSTTRKLRLGDRLLVVPVFAFQWEGTPVNVTVFGTDALRVAQKHRADGRPVERARLRQVEALLIAEPPQP
jgi:hypothetical protein